MRLLTRILSIANLLLAVLFFPLVPLLGWLNYGVVGWAVAWIPDAVLLTVLPAAYSLYWHYGLVIASLPLVLALWLWRRGEGKRPGRGPS